MIVTSGIDLSLVHVMSSFEPEVARITQRTTAAVEALDLASRFFCWTLFK